MVNAGGQLPGQNVSFWQQGPENTPGKPSQRVWRVARVFPLCQDLVATGGSPVVPPAPAGIFWKSVVAGTGGKVKGEGNLKRKPEAPVSFGLNSGGIP